MKNKSQEAAFTCFLFIFFENAEIDNVIIIITIIIYRQYLNSILSFLTVIYSSIKYSRCLYFHTHSRQEVGQYCNLFFFLFFYSIIIIIVMYSALSLLHYFCTEL